MGSHSPKRVPRIAHEIRTALPGQHIRTTAEEPVNGLFGEDFVSTGQDNPTALASVGHRLIGFAFGIGWLAWGIYVWWFVERTIIDFVVGTAVWAAAFVFSVVGVPIVRQAAKNRHRA